MVQTLADAVDCTVKWNLLGKNKKEIWGAASLSRGTYRGWDLFLSIPTHIAPETPQPFYVYKAEPTASKPL